LNEENIEEDNPRLAEIQVATDNVSAQMDQIQQNVLNSFPEMETLRLRIEELQQQVETEEGETARNAEMQLETRFWFEFGPTIEAAVIDYLAKI
jgi:capsule polysaccharide export protein KpsE/RkpR